MGATKKRRKVLYFVTLPSVLITLLLGGLFFPFSPNTNAETTSFAETAFQAQWQRSDKPVQDGSARRSWVWGPIISDGKTEPYKSNASGQRLVQYFDKARMEINNPAASRDSRFYVSNGLLVSEQISGYYQVSDLDFSPNPVGPSTVQVAGDPDNALALTYASFGPVASINGGKRVSDQTGQLATATLSKDGTPGQNPGAGSAYGIKYSHYDDTLGHNIADVFWNFVNEQGPIYQNGAISNDTVFVWEVAVGLPLTEPYWSQAIVNGQVKDVLVQMFQRRVLTYTPSNDDPFKVEMGNVGQHYFKWRYLTKPAATPVPVTTPPTTISQPAPAATTAAPKSKVPTTTKPPTTAVPSQPTQPPAQQTPLTPSTPLPPAPPAVSPPPGGSDWLVPPTRLSTPVAKPVVRVRPTDGQAVVIGENKGIGGIFVSFSGNGFSTNINLDPRSNGGEKVSADFDSDGNLHVFWHEDSGGVLHTLYARMEPSGKVDWVRDMANELANGSRTGVPNVYFNPNNRHLYLVHEEPNNTVVFYESADEGVSWGGRYAVSSYNQAPTGPRVVGDANGNVTVTWGRNDTGSGYSDVFVSQRINGSWTSPYNLSQYNGGFNAYPQGMTVGANGDVYLIWLSPVGGTRGGIGFARNDGTSHKWVFRRDNVSNSPAGLGLIKSARISVTSKGVLWVLFSLDNSNSSGNSGPYYSTSTDGGNSWSNQIQIYNQTETDVSDSTTYGNNVYFTDVSNRQTYFTFRSS